MQKQGSELKVGDTIEVWYRPGRDTITALPLYAGDAPLPEGTRIAAFALCPVGMTILPDDECVVIACKGR